MCKEASLARGREGEHHGNEVRRRVPIGSGQAREPLDQPQDDVQQKNTDQAARWSPFLRSLAGGPGQRPGNQ